jgi:hypothetical protein
MLFVPSVRVDKARPDFFVRALLRKPVIDAKLTVRIRIFRFLSSHNFQPIDRYHFAMRCFRQPLGGPRQTNTRGGES